MKILKYLDLFGINFHFYIGNKRKLYTSYGGIISLFYTLCCVIIFFVLTFKEVSRKNPISNISSVSHSSYHKVKFSKEKLWIPWRIIDFNKKIINFKDKLYPSIYIRKGTKNKNEDRFNFNTQNINYKLCNETDFAQKGKNHFIDVDLEKLYCMEIDNIELGGGWSENFLNYIQLDIYICKNGIEYDENNNNCTKFQTLKEFYTKNDSLAFEYFYPIVEYQPTNYENPILVIYKNHFYNFSSILDKEEKIFIQEYVLNDDKGLVFNDDINTSFYGYISSDFDIIYSNGDLLKEKHSSKLYSLSIFLDTGRILYTRRYNKIYTIVSNVFPIFNMIFFIFDYFTYMIKTIMTEKYLSELFFQRIKEDKHINYKIIRRKSAGFFFHKYKIDKSMSKRDSNSKVIYNIKKKPNDSYNRENNIKQSDISINNSENNNDDNNNNFYDNSCENYIDKNEKCFYSSKDVKINKKIKNNNMYISKDSSKDIKSNKSNLEKLNDKLKKIMAMKNCPNNNNNSSLHNINNQKINNFLEIHFKKLNEKNESNKNNHDEINNKNQAINKDMIIESSNKNMTKINDEEKNNELNENYNSKKYYKQFNFYKNKGLNNSAIITRFRLKDSLFGMKDYIYSFFIKAVRKDYKFLTKEFTAIFNFLSNVYDISSYLQLYKQFHILTGFLLDNGANIDLNHKININNKELFEQISLKNKNIFYFALKEQFNKKS